ncbi:tubulin-specific chaperone Rbl2 [Histoplasma capsulatum var. duboisii H88]|uniref:Tubulin-specific chaperone A n=2 Tax=Ajellomyces capsulatus TaxID=5037 RepID=F0U941_AJEC8|nr:tubulin-specific chaperone Rbl2 [Histoplasma capsulatum H143]EGC41835.1 tubulin-specific chaperone Rbl2 [Histoplasma capsulatum var. duboisii H88]QSS51748.1 tubulin-specific chaperone Rbl2 [Histoplasma capsulatum var. duboisii H88]
MPPLSPLSIATAAVQRLVKEEASYHRELKQQEDRIKRLEAEQPGEDADGNREYMLKQEHQALEETKKVLPNMKQKILESIAKVDHLLVEEGQKGMGSNVADINAAKEAISQAKTAIREVS